MRPPFTRDARTSRGDYRAKALSIQDATACEAYYYEKTLRQSMLSNQEMGMVRSAVPVEFAASTAWPIHPHMTGAPSLCSTADRQGMQPA
jgi:hypothetical protein